MDRSEPSARDLALIGGPLQFMTDRLRASHPSGRLSDLLRSFRCPFQALF